MDRWCEIETNDNYTHFNNPCFITAWAGWRNASNAADKDFHLNNVTIFNHTKNYTDLVN